MLTPGEPAGIGPDLAIMACQREWPFELVIAGDPANLRNRAQKIGLPLTLRDYEPAADPQPSLGGHAVICHQKLNVPARAGELDPSNATAVLAALDRACDGCLSGEFAAMVTGPVHKGAINDAGVPFSGHTEYLAQRCSVAQPVMLLVAGELRVALVTTHLALRDVPGSITADRLTAVLKQLVPGLAARFGIPQPYVLVLGLNPHAGEAGHLGREEIEIIGPVLDQLREQGMQIEGPLPADTAFTPPFLQRADAVLAMYHDQGLAVLKHAGFGRAVNVTLGLPIIRTSVDHGTALDLAGTGEAEPGSLIAALELASQIAERRR